MRPDEVAARLRGMLDAAGLRPEALELRASWTVFQRFLAEPIEHPALDDDTGMVQWGIRTHGEGARPQPCVYLVRQWLVDTPAEWEAAARDPALRGLPIHAVALGFRYPQDAGDIGDRIFLHTDYDSIDAFASDVEAHPGFRRALRLEPESTELEVD